MDNFTLHIWDDEATLCSFYTVTWEDSAKSETDKFFEKYDSMTEYKEATQELMQFVLEAIGENHGAIKDLFNRQENEVQGLPVQGNVFVEEITYHFKRFPLRLYALRISNELVILFNGGVKDNSTNQTSSLSMQWREACLFARKITAAIQDGTIVVNNRTIQSFDDSTEIYL